jgi:hypothetical protein
MGAFPLNNVPGTELSVLPIAVVIYFVLLWEARRPNSPSADDDQIGLKTIAAALTLVGVLLAAGGLKSVLHVLLTFSDFLDRIKAAAPDLLVGSFVTILAAFVLVPKTNAATFPKSKRLTAGAIALGAGTISVAALADLVRRLIAWPSWSSVADALTLLIVAGALFAIGMIALGRLSGLEMAPEAKLGAGQGGAQHQAPLQPQAYPGHPQQPQHAYQQQQQPQQPQPQPQPQQPQQGYPPYNPAGHPPYPPHGQQ